MVKFLIHRPIAVCITFIAAIFLGLVAFKKLPVSLLPDVPIPVITVYAENNELASKEMDNIVTQRLRRYLLQCDALKEIESVTKDGSCMLRMQFEHGTNTNISGIDVNEKIDRAMNSLPEGMERPRVFKASATDIPVFYLNLYYADTLQNKGIIGLSDFARNVVRRRLEQLEEVAMVDISGVVEPQIVINPRKEKVASIGMEPYHFEKVFNENNLELGSIQVNEGYYTYSVRLSNKQWGIEELRLMPVVIANRVFTIGELADIDVRIKDRQGMYLSNGQNCISLAVIKQSGSKVADLKQSLNNTLNHLENQYPDVELDIARDQIKLLDYSISGLKQSLIIGAILAFLIIFAFLADLRLPIIMGLILPVSIIVSFLFLMVFDISLNVISLSGIVLAVGMMIDNSIIVIDNITQYRERGDKVDKATVLATNEVIRPLLSSALTTCSVFIPLVFLSGISGALFKEQAITVSIGLGASLLVSITLLPTLYFLFFRKTQKNKSFKRKEILPLSGIYTRGFDFVFKYKILFLMGFIVIIPAMVLLFQSIKKESFPLLTTSEATLKIEWNESINVSTSSQRAKQINKIVQGHGAIMDAWVGIPDYILVRDYTDEMNTVFLWVQARNDKKLAAVLENISSEVESKYPQAKTSKLAANNVFEKTFLSNKPEVELRIYNETGNDRLNEFKQVRDRIAMETGLQPINKIKEREYIVLRYDAVKLSLYGILPSRLMGTLRAKLKNNQIGFYSAFNEQIPVVVKEDSQSLQHILEHETIRDKYKREIPIKAFVKVETETQPSEVTSGLDGQYMGLQYKLNGLSISVFEAKVKQIIDKEFSDIKYNFTGQVYDNKALILQLSVVLIVSVLLLYFILAAQFESLTQPLIVLLEIPIDIAGALLFLKIFGGSLNIMSAIGIIVMAGIIINDSILKIDTINRLRRNKGLSLMAAIHEGGNRRLRPIVMTSLTTILALVPFFFGHSMGVELQQPLALAVIGGLSVGTLVSLYFIPLLYWFIYRHQKESQS